MVRGAGQSAARAASDQPANTVKQKSSRAASRIKHDLPQRLRNRAPHDFEAPANPACNTHPDHGAAPDRSDFHIAPSEHRPARRATGTGRSAAQSCLPDRRPPRPASAQSKKSLSTAPWIPCSSSACPDRIERRIGSRNVQNTRGNLLPTTVNTLQKQFVVADMRAIDYAKQPVPQRAFQRDLRMRRQPIP